MSPDIIAFMVTKTINFRRVGLIAIIDEFVHVKALLLYFYLHFFIMAAINSNFLEIIFSLNNYQRLNHYFSFNLNNNKKK